jgi:hypothetical protein
MKKNMIFLLTLLLIGVNVSAQNVIGIWQKGSDIVGSGLGEAYHFFENDKFEFSVSQFSYLNNIISFRGTYKIQNNQICFIIESRKERVGTHIEQGSPAWQDNWIIEGGEIMLVKQDTTQFYYFDFSFQNDNEQATLKIGNSVYYKISKENEMQLMLPKQTNE